MVITPNSYTSWFWGAEEGRAYYYGMQTSSTLTKPPDTPKSQTPLFQTRPRRARLGEEGCKPHQRNAPHSSVLETLPLGVTPFAAFIFQD